jgi:hypothetical protein
MNSHLNQEQIIEALLECAESSSDQPWRKHLEICEQCRAELEASRSLFAHFGESARRAAERDDSFWTRQALVIASRIEHSARRRALRVLWGTVAATAAAVLLWLAMGRAPSGPTPPMQIHDPVMAKQYENQDDLLLRHVELALERPAPIALAPAEVLTQELNRTRATPRIKPISRPTK